MQEDYDRVCESFESQFKHELEKPPPNFEHMQILLKRISQFKDKLDKDFAKLVKEELVSSLYCYLAKNPLLPQDEYIQILAMVEVVRSWSHGICK